MPAPAPRTRSGSAARTPTPAAPDWLNTAGMNLARAAHVTSPAAPSTGVRTELLLTDGNGRVEDNTGRWVHHGPLPHVVEFRWDRRVRLGAARLISGYYRDGTVEAPVEDFAFEWHDGDAWRVIPGANVHGNLRPEWSGTFAPVETSRLRLRITATKGETSRIWEVEFYGWQPRD